MTNTTYRSQLEILSICKYTINNISNSIREYNPDHLRKKYDLPGEISVPVPLQSSDRSRYPSRPEASA